MNLPSDTPRLPKWIFFLGWACLIILAWFVHDGSSHPWAGGALLAIVVCVALASILVALPFVADYARSQDEALDNRQRALQSLSATVASTSEQVSIATAGLQKLTAVAEENTRQAERVAQQIQERVAELRASVAAARKDDVEAAARLEAAAKKILKAAAEFAADAARAPEIPRAAPAAPVPAAAAELPPVPLTKMVEIRPAVAFGSHAPFEAPAPAAAPSTESPAPSAEQPPAPAPDPAPPPRKRSPRKPAAPAELPLEAPAQETPDAPQAPEPAVSADGATRLIVTAYIGIGNRLFIRGEGPGLDWEKGVPLAFVSIGKWRWETNEASAPVRFKLYKNDEVECSALGERTVGPGAQVDLTASF